MATHYSYTLYDLINSTTGEVVIHAGMPVDVTNWQCDASGKIGIDSIINGELVHAMAPSDYIISFERPLKFQEI